MITHVLLLPVTMHLLARLHSMLVITSPSTSVSGHYCLAICFLTRHASPLSFVIPHQNLHLSSSNFQRAGSRPAHSLPMSLSLTCRVLPHLRTHHLIQVVMSRTRLQHVPTRLVYHISLSSLCPRLGVLQLVLQCAVYSTSTYHADTISVYIAKPKSINTVAFDLYI